MARGTRGAGMQRVGASIIASATMTATYDAALRKKHGARPITSIRMPPTAGPTTRELFITTLLRPTAFGELLATDHLHHEGLAGRVVEDVHEPEQHREHVDDGHRRPYLTQTIEPEAEREQAGGDLRVPYSRRRLSKRSAITPPHAPKSSIGRNWRPVSTPSATPLLFVSSRISHACASRCIHVPLTEMIWPVK